MTRLVEIFPGEIQKHAYRQISNISRTLVGNIIVDHSDVVGAACSSYIFILDLTPGFNGLAKDECKTRWKSFKFWDLVRLILEIYGILRSQ